MKLYKSCHIFNYPWEYVSAANWLKYPNDSSPHVIAVDTLRREVDPTTKVLRTERLITCEQSIPKWISAFIGSNRSYVREVSEIDPLNRTLVMRSFNMSYNNLLLVSETVTYSANALDNGTTKFEQVAHISLFLSFKMLTDKIEQWSLDRFQVNLGSGRRGFEGVLSGLSELWEWE